MIISTDEIVSTADIADLLGVNPSAVSNWKKRYKDYPKPFCFPEPFAVVGRGKIELYRRSEVVKWSVDRLPPSRKEGIIKMAEILRGENKSIQMHPIGQDNETALETWEERFFREHRRFPGDCC